MVVLPTRQDGFQNRDKVEGNKIDVRAVFSRFVLEMNPPRLEKSLKGNMKVFCSPELQSVCDEEKNTHSSLSLFHSWSNFARVMFDHVLV